VEWECARVSMTVAPRSEVATMYVLCGGQEVARDGTYSSRVTCEKQRTNSSWPQQCLYTAQRLYSCVVGVVWSAAKIIQTIEWHHGTVRVGQKQKWTAMNNTIAPGVMLRLVSVVTAKVVLALDFTP
jgi:hypothetical protein